MTTVVAIMACHNRRATTLRGLASLFGQHRPGVELHAVVVDDGSTDGTADAVRSAYPQVLVVPGGGDLYWAGGMALAQRHAVEHRSPDFLLWLNDDVVLVPTAVRDLVGVARRYEPEPIVAGPVCDSDTGVTTYTGLRRRGRRPRGFVVVEPVGRPEPVDAFHGNVVLVPRAAYEALGCVDSRMRQVHADLDYGLRGRRAGVVSVLAPRFVGTCDRNPAEGTWRDPAASRVDRVRMLFGPLGLPVGPHVRYCRRHGGRDWFVYVAACYAKALTRVLLGLHGATPARTVTGARFP